MNKQEDINKLIDDALNSADDIKRAAVKPFLLTRIHARMNKGKESLWEKAGWLIGRPAVAFTGLCMIILINIMVVMVNKPATADYAVERSSQQQVDEFSYTVATIYEIDNTQQNDK